MNISTLKDAVKNIVDFPKPGIIFKDITPILLSAQLFSAAIDGMCSPYYDGSPHKIVGVEARGFIFAAAMAARLNCGFVPIRKKGKLPRQILAQSYQLEYGQQTLELHQDSISPGDKIVLVDDILASGGTAHAAASLVEQLNGKIISIDFLIELSTLAGRKKISDYKVRSLIKD